MRLFQTSGDAIFYPRRRFPGPPRLIADFLCKWEEGYPIVLGVKAASDESPLFFLLRKSYYHVLSRLATVNLVNNATEATACMTAR